ncbi:unnamed protein product (macronuclear) [Paramecium tetraurelia]|uniref:Uncharacterized protein n=1 Tax=Paramecium tetraurelia TaxID=5888 RepID=A0BVT2_PARTE|nr:uncharacterized protein GSPATT00032501001 [Paramecium tetraurelia]CAK62649.1 unnamed protein product [Paramecium tetraurelia]|eukprot:XP_001430047.1 hypothetical protein (macronuclear) [Paramecium tetraurelia strain d4-2]
MVRLEKLVYEQLVNIRALKRERIIGSPRKWYSEPRTPAMTLQAVKLFTQGWTGLIYKFVEPLFARFLYRWMRNIGLDRGVAMEDLVLFQDRELRRDPLFEHIQREGFHPYTWILFNKRRARFSKVERGVRGSTAPEWLQAEARERTLADSVENIYEWDNYVYQNYMSDMTPTARGTILQKLLPLEWFLFFDTSIMKSCTRDWNTQKNNWLTFLNHSRLNQPLEEGRRQFEVNVNRFIDLYPGAIVREGEKFDFQRFYALEAINNNRDLSKFDSSLIAQLKSELTQQVALKTSTKVKKQRASFPSWLQQDGKGLLA